MRTIIALTGYARAGKDTVADMLVEDYGFTKMSFAGPLKRMLRTLDPYVSHWTEPICPCGDCNDEVETEMIRLSEMNGYTEDALKESFPEYRRLLQVLGTDCVRALDPEFWVNAARREVLMSDPDARIVFTDCRFPNEADMIRELAVHDVALVAQVAGRSLPSPDAHVSEQHVGKMGEELTVWNNGSMEALAGSVKYLAYYAGVGDVADIPAGV